MKAISIISACLFFAVTAAAQQARLRLDGRINQAPAQPLFIVDDSVITEERLHTLNPDKIASVDVLKDSSAVAYYGEKARNGVIIIHTKNHPSYLDLQLLLDQYHITGNDRKLNVCINNILVKNKSRILLDHAAVSRVEVITDICWKTPAEAGPEEKYINIVTKNAGK